MSNPKIAKAKRNLASMTKETEIWACDNIDRVKCGAASKEEAPSVESDTEPTPEADVE